MKYEELSAKAQVLVDMATKGYMTIEEFWDLNDMSDGWDEEETAAYCEAAQYIKDYF